MDFQADHITSSFLKPVFHKFYLVHSWIPQPIYGTNRLPKTSLTLLSPMFYFFTPWKLQKVFGFVTFLGGIEMNNWA